MKTLKKNGVHQTQIFDRDLGNTNNNECKCEGKKSVFSMFLLRVENENSKEQKKQKGVENQLNI